MANTATQDRVELGKVLDLTVELFLWAILCLTPLLVNVYNEDAYRTVQAMFLAMMGALGMGVWLFRVALGNQWRAVARTPMFWGFVAFDAWAAVSCLRSPSLSIALQSLVNLVLMTLVYAAVVRLVKGGDGAERAWRLAIPALIGLFANCVLGVMQYYHFDFMAVGRAIAPPNNATLLNYFAGLDAPSRQDYAGHGSAAGVLGNQNVLGDYMIGAMPLILAAATYAWRRAKAIKRTQDAMGLWEPGKRFVWAGWLSLVGALVVFGVLSLLCLYMTITAGAWIAFAVACLLWIPAMAAFFWPRLRRTNPRIVVGVAGAFLALALTVGGVAVHKQMTPSSVATFLGHKEHDFSQRVNAWKVANLMATDAPILGQGLGTYKIRYFHFLALEFKGNIPEVMHHRYVQAHNDWIQLAAETGWPGLALALGVIGAFYAGALRALWRRRADVESPEALLYLGSLAGMLAIMLSGLFGFPFHIAASGSLFVVLAGIVGGLWAKATPDPEPARTPSELARFVGTVGAPAAGVAALLLGLYFLVLVPYWADEHAKRGMDAYKAQQLDVARSELLQAVDLDPDRGDARMLLGMTFAVMQQYPMAAYHLEQVQRCYDDVTLHYYLGMVYESQGRLQEAKREFEVAETYFPAGTEVRNAVVKQLEALDKRLALGHAGTPAVAPASAH